MFGLARQLSWSSGTRTSAPIGTLLYTINNPNPIAGTADDFGFSVNVSGDYVIIGAPREDAFGQTDPGKAYIYNASNGALLFTLSNPQSTGLFGNAVSISGGRAIVGAYAADSGSGRVYIYNAITGALLHTLTNPNGFGTVTGDNFSRGSVAISANYAIVGAYNEDDAGGLGSGKAYIYNANTGALLHTLNNPNAYGTSAGDRFGWSVSINDTYAAVGAYTEADAGGINSGKVYVFNTTTGSLLYTLNNPNPVGTSATDYFGHSVCITETRLIAGAWGEDSAGESAGNAYIYNLSDGTLLRTLIDPNAFGTATSDFFGWSVSISNKYAIVGAPREDSSGDNQSGKAYIFDIESGSLLYSIDNPSPLTTDWLGESIAISDNYAIVGSYRNANKTYIYSVTS